jgi:cell division protein FtsL
MEKNDEFKTELENQYTILIKADQKKEKKFRIAVLVILSVTLLFVIISLIFAEQALNATKKDKTDVEQKIYYQTLNITYNTGSGLNINNIGNNYSMNPAKTITIKNDGTATITYLIKLKSIKTSLLSTNKLIYKITNNNKSESHELPLSEKIIVGEKTIKPNETHSYTIDVSYTGRMEENDYSNYYNATIEVEQRDTQTNLLQ